MAYNYQCLKNQILQSIHALKQPDYLVMYFNPEHFNLGKYLKEKSEAKNQLFFEYFRNARLIPKLYSE